MKWVIVGHRGVGKTSLLKRWSYHKPKNEICFFDLDHEIEKASGHKIQDIFEQEGEARFRQWEREIFQSLVRRLNSFVIALGAGFDLSSVPSDVRVFWLRRESDLKGRIFLDRPRLRPDLNPLQEYEQKRQEREVIFADRADCCYVAPEGVELSLQQTSKIEKMMLSEQTFAVGGVLTLFPRDLHRLPKAMPDLYELRDDLLETEVMDSFLSELPGQKILYSVRTDKEISPQILKKAAWIDVDVKWVSRLKREKTEARWIFSSHAESWSQALQGIQKAPAEMHLKISPVIQTWQELTEGFQWQQVDPQRRSFLPRSKEGRWTWFRLFQKNRQLLNFWYAREDSALDQPSLFQWLSVPKDFTEFVAVLGSPVRHSFSPLMHLDFFLERNQPFWAVDIAAEEFAEAFSFLRSLGLKAAAVTSPLKFQAFSVTEPSPLAQELQSVNTLVFDQDKWWGHNTDFAGFQKAFASRPFAAPVVVWGGGGTLAMLRKAVPKLHCYSARTGQPRMEGDRLEGSPGTLIWAATRPGAPLPLDWRPQVIWDLGYTDFSTARAYALQIKIPYISGLDFFKAQALEQRQFWSEHL